MVDEIEVRGAAASNFSLKEALVAKAPTGGTAAGAPVATEAPAIFPKAMVSPKGEAGPGMLTSDEPLATGVAAAAPAFFPQPVIPAGEIALPSSPNDVQMAAATEDGSDALLDSQITAAVVSTLGNAQRQGQLKGFGVDVNTRDGKVFLNGRASSQDQRRLITELVRSTPGVYDVSEDIIVMGGVAQPIATQELELLPQPLADTYVGNPAPQQRQGTPAQMASSRGQSVPAQTAPYQMGQPVHMQQASMAMNGGYGPMPVPMGPAPGVGSGPRYEQPYLPNYAWPGYAAYPNYAAVSYPQQYSPSAFPYIGPFYPYPQVPLGWRKVSLEWDDGWWFLDFTDK
ncbi:MAG TPA: hypothetical protein DDZ51_16280 [Planctomycetaceae bacterium]|nr:hypothetical protein [Planctomycetaceae bacterium]